MPQAHARVEREPEELVQSQTDRASLRALPELLDDDLFDIASPGRSRPRRPTGAAADYARSNAGTARRTVKISGYGAQTSLRPTPSELRGPRPDRIAGWVVAFAILLAILAAVVGG